MNLISKWTFFPVNRKGWTCRGETILTVNGVVMFLVLFRCLSGRAKEIGSQPQLVLRSLRFVFMFLFCLVLAYYKYSFLTFYFLCMWMGFFWRFKSSKSGSSWALFNFFQLVFEGKSETDRRRYCRLLSDGRVGIGIGLMYISSCISVVQWIRKWWSHVAEPT